MTKKILIVDDDETFCEVLALALSKRDYDVRVCSLERGGMAMPLFRPAVPSLHPALTFRCSVTSLARCTNF